MHIRKPKYPIGLTVRCIFTTVSLNSNLMTLLGPTACTTVQNGEQAALRQNGKWACGVSIPNHRKVKVQWVVWGLCVLVRGQLETTVPGQLQAVAPVGQRVESGPNSLQLSFTHATLAKSPPHSESGFLHPQNEDNCSPHFQKRALND